MTSGAASFRVLSLCTARPNDAAIGERLRSAVAHVRDWTALVSDAEEHRLESLLFAHARECRLSLPADTETRLKACCVRHAHAAAVRTRVIGTVLDELEAAAIPALVLKGAALAHLVYPFPFLRPCATWICSFLRIRPIARGDDSWRLGFRHRARVRDPDITISRRSPLLWRA